MERILCPSLMCANFDYLKEEVERLDKAGTDIFHCDIMDGVFVKNMALSPYDVQAVKRNTNKLVDVHLMVSNPDLVSDIFINMGIDIIYVHPESDIHIARTLQKIRNANLHPGIAINPGTSLETVRELFPLVDYVMVMTVNPGFAGQKYIPSVDDKIKRLLPLKEEYGFKVVVDGAISEERVMTLSEWGVDGFVLGTSALFNKPESYEVILKRLHDNNQ